MIINLRGGNGSGKSYLVHSLKDKLGHTPVLPAKGTRPLYHKIPMPWGESLAVVGPYVSACGGCDAIHPYTEIWPRVLSARARCDHVLYEGMAVSSSYGTLGRASEQFGDEVVFVFLDTPLSVCLERVNARRAARGADVANFDPHDIIKKWRDVQRTYPKIVATGRQVVVLDHRDPVPGLLNLLHRGYDRKRTGPPFPRDVPPLPPRIRLTAKERRRLGAQKTEDARSQGGGLFA